MSRKKRGGFPFGKKPAADGDAQEQLSTQETSLAGRNKKERVLHETTFAAAADSFRKNKLFCVKRDGDTVWVGAKLELSQIGGLSSKDKNDESKGQIISLINNGTMSVMLTELLMNEDAVVFIPNEATVKAMADFSLLGDTAIYELVIVDNESDGAYEATGIKVGLSSLQELHRSGRSVDTLDGMDDVLADADFEAETASIADVNAQEGQEGSFYEQSVDDAPPEDDSGPDLTDAAVAAADQHQDDGDEFESDYIPDEDEMPEDDDGEVFEDAMPEEPAPEMEQTVFVPEEATTRVLARKFFNDELSRVLTSETLDQAIEPNVPLRLEVKPDGWLADQYNRLVAIANEELLTLHNQHLMQLRQSYLDTMATAYQKEMSGVTQVEDDPRYIELARKAQEIREGLPHRVDEVRKQIQDEWDEKLESVGEAARQQAIQSYRDRYAPVHEERLRNAGLNEEAKVNVSFETAVSNVKNMRRQEAMNRLDALDTETVELLKAEYETMAKRELEVFEKHRSALLAWLEENKAAEISRIKVLEEEQRQADRIAKLEREYQARVESLQTEYNARAEGMQEDIRKMQERHEVDLQAKDNEAAYAKKLHEQENEQQNARIDQLLKDIGELDDKAKAAVAAEMARIQAERDETERKYNVQVDSQKKHNRLMLSVGLLAVIAALCAGLFFGGYIMQRRDLADKQNEVLQQVVDVLPQNDTGAGN